MGGEEEQRGEGEEGRGEERRGEARRGGRSALKSEDARLGPTPLQFKRKRPHLFNLSISTRASLFYKCKHPGLFNLSVSVRASACAQRSGPRVDH